MNRPRAYVGGPHAVRRRYLSLAHNQIKSLVPLLQTVQQRCPDLRWISLFGNPACPGLQTSPTPAVYSGQAPPPPTPPGSFLSVAGGIPLELEFLRCIFFDDHFWPFASSQWQYFAIVVYFQYCAISECASRPEHQKPFRVVSALPC